MTVLVTGGAGYIGSHTCVELIAAGFEVVVLDNFCNSKPEALKRVEELVGQRVPYYDMDVTDRAALRTVFERENIESVIHFAGLKAVGESCEKPLIYYDNNVGGTVALCQVMQEFEVDKLLFSSSATVYGDPASVPITEEFPVGAVTNPYGRSKFMVEELLRDLCRGTGRAWKVSLLRYFNPIGAHVSGRIGEDPQGIPNNLLPFVAQVAVGKLPRLKIFGGDYNTPDGTGVRDYIHVVDLARGHVRALEKLTTDQAGCYTYNLGTGRGYSVLDVVAAFERTSGKSVPYDIVARRPGDIAQCYADPHRAAEQLGWRAEFDLDRMVEDAWRWQSVGAASLKP